MPKLKFEELEGYLSKGRLFPIYIIYGEENYLMRILVEKICEVYHAETGAEVERHTAKGLDVVSVLDGLKTLPMWAKGKLVLIGEGTGLGEKAKDLLTYYAKNPVPSTILVLTASKFDGRSKLIKAVNESGAVVEVSAIYENQMPMWISRECKKEGRTISQEAAHFMAELVGTNLSSMVSAVDKIILYIGDKKIIETGDVETVLSDTSQKSIFNLANAVGERNLVSAENCLMNLLRYNEPPVLVVNMLARHFRLLLKAKEAMTRGKAGGENIARVLGVHPFFAKDYVAQSKNFSSRQLASGIKRLYLADVSVKSSKLPRETILHGLIIDLINLGN